MKKSILMKVLFVVLAVTVSFGAAFMVGGCGKDEETTAAPAVAFKGNVFLDSILPNNNYKWFHNSSSPDHSKMLVAVNQADAPSGVSNGKIDLYLLDAAELEKGKVVKLASNTVTAVSTKANAFRSSWSADGSKIFMAAGDTFFVVNGSTLAEINQLSSLGGDNHDALATEDGAFAVLTLRNKPYSSATDSNKVDGSLRLYSAATNTMVGALVSVCDTCHGSPKTSSGSILCGITGKLTKGTDGKYSGTAFVAGHGGHFAKVAITIDPANTTSPITATPSFFAISAEKLSDGTSSHKLHDGRLDGDTLYWSTYNTDANGQLHYGKVKIDGTGLVNLTTDLDAKAVKPGAGVGKAPIYCGSGQTAKAFMPSTMTNEAYISVFPKADIK